MLRGKADRLLRTTVASHMKDTAAGNLRIRSRGMRRPPRPNARTDCSFFRQAVTLVDAAFTVERQRLAPVERSTETPLGHLLHNRREERGRNEHAFVVDAVLPPHRVLTRFAFLDSHQALGEHDDARETLDDVLAHLGTVDLFPRPAVPECPLADDLAPPVLDGVDLLVALRFELQIRIQYFQAVRHDQSILAGLHDAAEVHIDTDLPISDSLQRVLTPAPELHNLFVESAIHVLYNTFGKSRVEDQWLAVLVLGFTAHRHDKLQFAHAEAQPQ